MCDDLRGDRTIDGARCHFAAAHDFDRVPVRILDAGRVVVAAELGPDTRLPARPSTGTERFTVEGLDAFHAEALGAGGRSSWEPGIRPEFSRDYYAARIQDPDGNSIEVVCRGNAAAAALDRPVAA